ncbi:hypothetical protein STRIP9103_06848 [Streptomyces ipomoeae 91-03]|uniref:Uncharacterized protein n=1 Tax=Streptomyces ipomoeae 91-03 TaxID=698759 RepID=L1L0C9_9ACTN|nr:hypothetical protein STRIP9103_06848 [Streptomyces ipomoeae 91-03]
MRAVPPGGGCCRCRIGGAGHGCPPRRRRRRLSALPACGSRPVGWRKTVSGGGDGLPRMREWGPGRKRVLPGGERGSRRAGAGAP